jgi:hypothetical protein
MLTITPAANDKSQQIMFSDGRLSSIADTKPPSPIPKIPANALNKIICSISQYSIS